MGSINAQLVAQKVSGTIRKGKKVVLAEIIKDVGYSASIADSPSYVTNTQSYKKALELETRPILEGLQTEINRIKDALSKKDLSQEEYRVLVYSLDVITKNQQLLTGNSPKKSIVTLLDDKKARLLAILNDNA